MGNEHHCKEIETLKRRLRERCTQRDQLLHQLSEVVAKIDQIKEQLKYEGDGGCDL